MENKKAFVFDTNFIIQNKKLDEVVENLKDTYSVYVTQLSIEERIAQYCRELKTNYAVVEDLKHKYCHWADISLKKSYEEECEYAQMGIQNKYNKVFGNNIINYFNDGETLSAILDRANKKLPPFSNAKDASDKGFKDYLLWISLLRYFKDNGENEVVFVTDDKSAFRNHEDFLAKEFNEITGKDIEFKPNVFYKELLKTDYNTAINSVKKELPDVSKLRDRIVNVMYGLCGFEVEGQWDDKEWVRTFTLNQKVDANYMEEIFDELYYNIQKYLLYKSVFAGSIFDLDGRFEDNGCMISMSEIEDAYYLHKEIKEKYADYLGQFYELVADIFNGNYVAPMNFVIDEEVPF